MSDDRHDESDHDAPDAPITAAERTRAESFAKLVDGLVADQPPPPAMAADERDLLEIATALRASVRPATVDASRVTSAIDAAYTGLAGSATGDAGNAGHPDVVPIGRKRPGAEAGDGAPTRSRLVRAVPWVISAVACAAAIALALRGPIGPRAGDESAQADAESVRVPVQLRSRPADALIGRIDRADAGDARARIDAIHADRMIGYRGALLSRGGNR